MNEAERMDRQIAVNFKKLFLGKATAAEISEGIRLLHERASFMMPKAYTRRRGVLCQFCGAELSIPCKYKHIAKGCILYCKAREATT